MFIVTYNNYEGAVLGLTKYIILPIIVIGPFFFPTVILWNDGQVLGAAACTAICAAVFYFAFTSKGFMKAVSVLGILGCWVGALVLGDHLQKSFEARDNEVRHMVSIIGYDFGGYNNGRTPPLAALFPEEIHDWSASLDIQVHYSGDKKLALIVPVSEGKIDREQYVIKPKSMMKDYHRLAARHGDWFGLARECTTNTSYKRLPDIRPTTCSSWDAIKENFGIDVPVQIAALLESASDKSCVDYAICDGVERYFGLALPEETAHVAAKD